MTEVTAPWAISYGTATPKEIHRHLQTLGLAIPPREPVASRGSMLAILDGDCCLSVPSLCEPVSLSKGDFVLLTRAVPFSVSDAPCTTAVPVRELIRREHIERRVGLHHGGGGARTIYLKCGYFFEDDFDHPLLAVLPPLIHLRSTDPSAAPWLTDTLRLLTHEATHRQPGSQSVINHLTHLLFLQTIRAYVTAAADDGEDLPLGKVDPQIAPALALIRQRPEKAWTVAMLADQIGLSRSVFAARFLRATGLPPLQFLTDYRMRKARAFLRDERLGLKAIAKKVGYATESAFSNAFRRTIGMSPGAYRKSKA